MVAGTYVVFLCTAVLSVAAAILSAAVTAALSIYQLAYLSGKWNMTFKKF